MSFVPHTWNIFPSFFLLVINFNRVKSLLSRKSSNHKDLLIAKHNWMSISSREHYRILFQLFRTQCECSHNVLRRAASSSNHNLILVKSNRSWAIEEFFKDNGPSFSKFLHSPFILHQIIFQNCSVVLIISKYCNLLTLILVMIFLRNRESVACFLYTSKVFDF